MCRLLGYCARRPASLAGLVGEQELREFTALSCLHSDGWGMAWADGGPIGVRKSPLQASEDPGYDELARQPLGRMGMVHLRYATPGLPVELENTHPFLVDDVAMAHNGAIHPQDRLPGLLPAAWEERMTGSTDSERYLLHVLSRSQAGADMVTAIGETAAMITARFTVSSQDGARRRHPAPKEVMSIEEVEVVVVGGGQAGIAMSEHLSNAGVPHVIMERGRIAETWRSGRWDSLVANGPAWHDRFPGLEFDTDPGTFVPKEQVADYFETYARKIAAPIRCGVTVTSVRKNNGRPGFTVETSAGSLDARFVVAATGPFQKPVIPPIIPADADVEQIHSGCYRNPGQLPAGSVLVVGAGSSGVQIAADLQESGRQVYLSVGPHDRPPRRYRGRDNVWWLGVLGMWEMSILPWALSM